jgi:PAS domain S-box-containing protein
MRTTDFPDDRALTNAEQQLFLQRLRAAVWIILFSVLITTVEDAYGHPRILGWMLLIKLALMATVMVLAWSLRFAAARARPELIGLLGVTATCVTTAYLGVLRADLMTTHIVLMVIALAASAVLPWGLGPQLVAAGIALLSILASTYALTGRIGLVAGYPAAGLLIALLVILYVTHEFARYRRAIVRHSRELLEYREAVEHAHDLIYSAAPDGTLIFVNRSWREALGYHATDVAGLSMWTVVHPDSRVRYGEIVRRVMAGEDVGPTEVLFVTAHGAALTAEGTITCARDHGTVTATRGFFRDVTARQRAEEARRQSEQHFRSLIENAPDLITVMNADGTIKYDSPSYGRVLGYTLEERIGTNGFGLVHPDDASHVLDVFTRGMQVPGQSAHLEFRYRHKDGSWRYFESTGTNLLHDPAVAGVVVNSHDITERKQMEDAVHNSEEYLKLLFEYAPDAYYLNDAEGTLVDGNRAAEELTGYGREELRGQSFLTLDLIAGGCRWRARRLG